jgi:ribonucleoside-diphosphate reductase alpha chain
MMDNFYIKKLDNKVQKHIKKYGLRNLRLNNLAPTGTVSRLSGVSGGIEPNFAYEYTIHDRIGDRTEYHWLYKRKKELGLDENLFICSSDLTSKQHIDIQAICQENIESSISKTVNAPTSSTIEDVKELFLYAYEKGLKGITYYRDGSRTGVLRKIEKEEKEQEVTELEKMFNEAGNNVITDSVKIPIEPPVKLYKRKDNHKKK